MGVLGALLEAFLGALGLSLERRSLPPPPTVARTEAEARTRLDEIARRLGFALEHHDRRSSLSGTVERCAVRVDVRYRVQEGQVRFHLKLVADAGVVLPAPLAFVPREAARAGAFTCGDPRFDEVFRTEGDDALALLVLTPAVREVLVGIGGHVEVADTELRFEARRAATFLERLVRQLVALRRLLETHGAQTPEALARRIHTEPIAELRARCLGALLQRHRGHETSTAACRRALADASPRVRLKAALHLGPEGQETLVTLAGDPLGEPGLRMAAARHLDPVPDDLLATLLAQLEETDAQVLTAARLLGRIGRPTALGPLARVAQSSKRSAKVRAAVGQAVGRLQERFPEAQGGQLSMVTEDAGTLSLPETSGALSEMNE